MSDLESTLSPASPKANSDLGAVIQRVPLPSDEDATSFWRKSLSVTADGWDLGLFAPPAGKRSVAMYRRKRLSRQGAMSKIFRWLAPNPAKQSETILQRLRTRIETDPGSLKKLVDNSRARSIGLGSLILSCWAQVHSRAGKNHYLKRASNVDSTGRATFIIVHSGRISGTGALAVPTVNMLPVHVQWSRPDPNLTGALASSVDHQLKSWVDNDMEQSRLRDIWRWCGKSGRNSDVFVNIAPVHERDEEALSKRVLRPVKVWYMHNAELLNANTIIVGLCDS